MWQKILESYTLSPGGICAFSALEKHLRPCAALSRLPAHPARVLVSVFPYRFPDTAPRNLSRYACVPDYHKAAGAVLAAAAQALKEAFPDSAFVPLMDNSPLPEVRAASLAGLGLIGDNGLLLHPVYGSWVFIGCIVTDAPFPYTDRAPLFCPHCGTCTAACSAPAACLSALSQKKGTLTDAEQKALRTGGLVWGCDRCQEVCPLNAAAKIAPHPCFSWYRPLLTVTDTEDLTDKAYGWRGSAVLRRNLALFAE